MTVLWFLLDLLILVLASARLTRLIVSDSLGLWWVQSPAIGWAERGDGYISAGRGVTEPRFGWRHKLVSGLHCPWCVGFWLALGTLAALALAGGPGDAAVWWRIGAGALALSYASAALGTSLGDFEHGDEG